ncbi:hypothetical protein GCM10020366_10710 [Saccharopolyspora gregorii]|uniref:DUF1330 domain-containing protein n=1 Tax=Saccharopolyspora gregorii TaxID=33914 RepID=A0ABP6RM90_9PSEU
MQDGERSSESRVFSGGVRQNADFYVVEFGQVPQVFQLSAKRFPSADLVAESSFAEDRDDRSTLVLDDLRSA